MENKTHNTNENLDFRNYPNEVTLCAFTVALENTATLTNKRVFDDLLKIVTHPNAEELLVKQVEGAKISYRREIGKVSLDREMGVVTEEFFNKKSAELAENLNKRKEKAEKIRELRRETIAVMGEILSKYDMTKYSKQQTPVIYVEKHLLQRCFVATPGMLFTVKGLNQQATPVTSVIYTSEMKEKYDSLLWKTPAVTASSTKTSSTTVND